MFSFLKKKKADTTKGLVAHISGKVIPIEQVKDEVFSSKMLGDGLGIEPSEENIVSPCDGVVTSIMVESKHALGITINNVIEILIHEGLDTVALAGEGFELYVKEGQKVKVGDKLLKFDAKLLESKGMEKTCVLVVTNFDEHSNIKFVTGIDAVAGETTIITY